jgi:hypothetical protein
VAYIKMKVRVILDFKFFLLTYHLCLLYFNITNMELTILSPVPTTKVKNDRMEVDDEEIHLVNPGETVTTDQQFMR